MEKGGTEENSFQAQIKKLEEQIYEQEKQVCDQ